MLTFVQCEMKLFGGIDTEALKQHFGKKITELEEEKRIVQVEKIILKLSLPNMLLLFFFFLRINMLLL